MSYYFVITTSDSSEFNSLFLINYFNNVFFLNPPYSCSIIIFMATYSKFTISILLLKNKPTTRNISNILQQLNSELYNEVVCLIKEKNCLCLWKYILVNNILILINNSSLLIYFVSQSIELI